MWQAALLHFHVSLRRLLGFYLPNVWILQDFEVYSWFSAQDEQLPLQPWQQHSLRQLGPWSSWVFSRWTWKLALAATTWRRTSATARSQKLSVMHEVEPGRTGAIHATPPPTRIIPSARSSTRGDASMPPPTAVNARCLKEHAIRL